jgi:hypothetical protein
MEMVFEGPVEPAEGHQRGFCLHIVFDEFGATHFKSACGKTLAQTHARLKEIIYDGEGNNSNLNDKN